MVGAAQCGTWLKVTVTVSTGVSTRRASTGISAVKQMMAANAPVVSQVYRPALVVDHSRIAPGAVVSARFQLEILPFVLFDLLGAMLRPSSASGGDPLETWGMRSGIESVEFSPRRCP